ncbi:MAG: hypothetical protein ABIT01_12490, partial [Thermoanaerobaculia bacterium]
MRFVRPAFVGAFSLLVLHGELVAADLPPSRKALTLERITGEPALVAPGMTGISWRDGKRFTYLAREGTGADARKSLWQYDTATQKREKLIDSVPVPDSSSRAEGKPRTVPLAGAQWNGAGTALLLTGDDDL